MNGGQEMKLVKIEDKWINQEFVCAVYGNERFTEVELVNSDKPFGFKMSIEKVLQAIEGSQEHSDDETKSYSFHDENADATLLVNNSTATVNLIDSDGIENLFFKRD